MQLAKASTHKGADLLNWFRMRKSLAAGGEIGGGCGSPTGKVGCERNVIVSPNRKNGFASNPVHANLASNNAALAQSR